MCLHRFYRVLEAVCSKSFIVKVWWPSGTISWYYPFCSPPSQLLTALIPSSYCNYSIILLHSSHHPAAFIPSSHCTHETDFIHSSDYIHPIIQMHSSNCSHPIFPLLLSHNPIAHIPSSKQCHDIIRMYVTALQCRTFTS